MTTLFMALNTADTTLGSDQIALETISHNVANASNSAYSQQTADLAATPPFTIPSMMSPVGPGQIGTGVEVTNIARSRDALLDAQYRYENQLGGQWSTLDTAYTQIQNVFGEPSTTGLDSRLSAFWNSWQGLATDPTNAGARASVQQDGIALAQSFNSLSQQLTQEQQNADQNVTANVTTINSLATQIANLNQQIATVAASKQQPNDLMDQRDQLIDQLSNIAPIIYNTAANGTVTINLATQVPGSTTLQIARPTEAALVSGITTNLLVANPGGMPTYAADGKTYVDTVLYPTLTDPVGGTLGSFSQVRDSIIGGATGEIAALNTVAQALVATVNVQHAAGFDANGNTGQAFFNVSPPAASLTAPFTAVGTVTAANITVDPLIVASPQAIMAASAAGAPGDGANAQAIGNLRTVLGAGGSPLPGQTAQQGYEQIITTLGAQAQVAHNDTQTQSSVMQSLTAQRQSIGGVNQDEQMTMLIQFQHSYEAAARVVTIVDSLLNTVIHMGLGN
jgi:flagellar hook-associated protein 1